jgi:hypothetical protein
MPPWIILFYFYGKNIDAVSYWQTLIAAFIFSLLSLIFYIIVSHIEKSRHIYTQQNKSRRAYILKYSAPAAALTIALWIISAAIMPLYDAMLEIFTKPVRYAACGLCAAAAAGAVFILARNIKRKEIFILAAVFETVLFALNFIPGTFLFAARKDARIQIPVDLIPPPPHNAARIIQRCRARIFIGFLWTVCLVFTEWSGCSATIRKNSPHRLWRKVFK